MHLGLTEIIIVLFLIIAIFSPSELQNFARMVGKTVHKVKEMKQDVTKVVNDVKDPINDAMQPLQDVKVSIDDIKRDLKI